MTGENSIIRKKKPAPLPLCPSQAP